MSLQIKINCIFLRIPIRLGNNTSTFFNPFQTPINITNKYNISVLFLICDDEHRKPFTP